MRRRSVLLAAATLLLFSPPALAHHVADLVSGGGVVVACLGDSNTQEWDPGNFHACGSPDTQTTMWCTRLATMVQPLGWTVRNHAVFGATVLSPNPLAPGFTSTASQQLTAALAVSPTPDVVILAFGTNDLAQPISSIVAAYAAMKQTIEAGGRRAMIALTPPQATANLTNGTSSNALIEQLNSELRARFTGADDLIDLASGLVPGSTWGSVDYTDSKHMNNCGQEKRAIAAFEQLTHAHDHFTMTIVDKTTGAPIPDVRLSTTNAIVYTSDANGRIDFYEPGIMGTTVYFSFDACVDEPDGNPATKWCELDHTASCTTDLDCTEGREAVGLPFFGSCFRAAQLRPYERGTVQLRLCPGGTSPVCPNAPGPGQCVSDVVVGANAANPVPLPGEHFAIRVVDAATGRGVPIIEVRSPSRTFVTDSAGNVAYYEAGLMGTTVHFDVIGHGYAATSANLLADEGDTATIQVTRVNIAERLYRVTGGGIYRDSVLLDEATPVAAPLINRQVFGQDSTLTAVYQSKIFWIWGDTSKPGHALGNFRSTAATSDLPGQGGLAPEVGVNLTYFGDGKGFVSEMCTKADFPNANPNEPALCWMSSLSVVKDAGGNEKLYAIFAIITIDAQGNPVVERSGLARYDDAAKRFVWDQTFPSGLPATPAGHPETVTHNAADYLYFITRSAADIDPSPVLNLKVIDNPVRIGATEVKLTDPERWEAFTALRQGKTDELVIRGDGTLNYDWKTDTSPITGTTGNIYNGGPIPNDQRLFGHTKDPESGVAMSWPSAPSTAWNVHRRRYVQPIGQAFGVSSFLGEIWFNEADTPMGPWVYARKIITHDNYTFYNPRLHPFFTQDGGRYVFFENTYTTGYTNTAVPTPRDNYNQAMYRLDLDDARIVLPVPVYDTAGSTLPGNFITKAGYRPSTTDETAPFMAPDRAGMTATVPLWWNDASCKSRALVVGGTPLTTPVFWALPGNASSPPAATVPLYEFVKNSNGAKAYSIKTALSGFTRVTNPVARVWTNPIQVRLPVSDYLAPLIADAGTDKCATVSGGGTAAVNLSAGGSRNAKGTITSYQWTWTGGGSGSASGATPTVVLPAGLYDIELTITGSGGDTSVDNVVVRVSP